MGLHYRFKIRERRPLDGTVGGELIESVSPASNILAIVGPNITMTYLMIIIIRRAYKHSASEISHCLILFNV